MEKSEESKVLTGTYKGKKYYLRPLKYKTTKYKGKWYYLKPYEVGIAIDSGKAGDKVHFPYFDYDENYPTDGLEIMWTFGLRRALIVESSPKRWQFLSFTPMPIESIFHIYWYSKLIDRHHAASFMRARKMGMRVSEKVSSKGYPKIRKVLCQEGGDLQFYDYEAERHYRAWIERQKAECLKGEDKELEREVEEWQST